jgi:SAM-dependent methyltransferase
LSATLSLRSSKYWDENKEKSLDPAFWMAHPLCRGAINRRVSGSPDEWPLDWFRRLHVPRPFGRGVSWGCGLGAFERSAIRAGIVEEIDAFDISPQSLEAARGQARAEKMESIHYSPGDFDDPRLARRRYDIVFFHASLHHVSQLERLFSRLALALKPGGAIYLDEYIGPSRDRWDGHRLRVARALLDLLPPEARLQQELQPSSPTTRRRRSAPRRSRSSSTATSRQWPGGPTGASSWIFSFPVCGPNGPDPNRVSAPSACGSRSRNARSRATSRSPITLSPTGA